MATIPVTSITCALDTSVLVDKFLEFKRVQGCAPATLQNYSYALRKLVSYHPRLPLEPSVIQQWIHEHSGKSQTSKLDMHRILSTFYRWLNAEGLLTGKLNPWPRVVAPIVQPTRPRVFSLTELRKIIEASRPGTERALIVTLIDTGARIGELRLATKDDLSDGCLRVSGKTGQRLLVMSPATFGYLQDMPTFHLFPQKGRGTMGLVMDAPYTIWGLRQLVTRIIERAGLTGSKLGAHTIRHSYATHYINRGGDLASLQLLMGHRDLRTTTKYISLATAALKAKHEEHSVFNALTSLEPAPSKAVVEAVELPPEVAAFPVFMDGSLALLFLTADRREHHIYYYIRARESGKNGRDGARKWFVLSLGSDLPLPYVDGLRMAIVRENQRRQALAREGNTTQI